MGWEYRAMKVFEKIFYGQNDPYTSPNQSQRKEWGLYGQLSTSVPYFPDEDRPVSMCALTPT